MNISLNMEFQQCYYVKKIAENIGKQLVIEGHVDIIKDVFRSIKYDDYYDQLEESFSSIFTEEDALLVEASIKEYMKDLKNSKWNPPLSSAERSDAREQAEDKAYELEYNVKDMMKKIRKGDTSYMKGHLYRLLKKDLGESKLAKMLGRGALKVIGKKGRDRLANYLQKKAWKQHNSAINLRKGTVEDISNSLERDRVETNKLNRSIGRHIYHDETTGEKPHSFSKEGIRQGLVYGVKNAVAGLPGISLISGRRGMGHITKVYDKTYKSKRNRDLSKYIRNFK